MYRFPLRGGILLASIASLSAPGCGGSDGADAGNSADTGTPTPETGTPTPETGIVDTGLDTMSDSGDTSFEDAADSGTDTEVADTGSGDSCSPTTLTVAGFAAPNPIWAGGNGSLLTAKATLTPSGTVSYAWSLLTKPTGSSALLSGTGANVELFADLPGSYGVRVTASASCAGDKTVDFTLTAYDAPVFYQSFEDLTFPSGGGRRGGLTLRIAGAVSDAAVSGSPLTQAFFNDSSTNDWGTYDSRPLWGMDVWEPSFAGTPSRTVFAWYAGSAAGPNTSQRVLYAATSESRDSPASKRPVVLVGPIPDPGAPASDGQTMKVGQPSFSPDGSRVAYLKYSSSSIVKLATIGFDGSAPRELGNYFTGAGTGTADGANTNRPQWLSNTVLGWSRAIDSTNWEVVTATDSAAVTPSKFFSCGGILPRSFAFVSSGGATRILVSKHRESATTTGDLVLYQAVGGTCDPVANISKLSGSQFVQDFTLSPDRTKVAYLVRSGGTDPNGGNAAVEPALYIANADGTVLATKIPLIKPVAKVGPRYVAGGARIVLTLDGEPASFPVSGAPVHTLQAKSAGATLSTAGNGGLGACAVSGGVGVPRSPKSFAFIGLAFATALVTGRRARKRPAAL